MRIFGLTLSLACRSGTPVNNAPPPGPTFEAVGTLVEYREADISKVQGTVNEHSYATIALAPGAPGEALAIARDGHLYWNVPVHQVRALTAATPAVGDRISFTAVASGTDAYVVPRSLTILPKAP